jgi:two-component system KDP operon response regulator KdpE
LNRKYKILVVEDENNILNFVKTILETNTYNVVDAMNGLTGKMLFMSHRPDLVILDLGLPDIDGLEFIKEIRKESDTPIIVLSARTNESDKVTALDLGANDYVTKPFGTEELLARVRATLRNSRYKKTDGEMSKQKYCVGDMIIDYEYRRVTKENMEIKLTQTEYNIVELLSMHPGRVLTYTDIIKKIWGYADSGSIKKLQVNMANIRKKLGEKPGDNKYIANELGVGYRINEENEVL